MTAYEEMLENLRSLDVLRIEYESIQDRFQTEEKKFFNYLSDLYLDTGQRQKDSIAYYLFWERLDLPAKYALKFVDRKYGQIPSYIVIAKCPDCDRKVEVSIRRRSALEHFEQTNQFPTRVGCCKNCARIKRDHEVQKNQVSKDYNEWNFLVPNQKEEQRLSLLKSMPYGEYLQTPEWKEIRKRKLRKAGWKCQLCNNGGNLNVHHRTYERRGHENLSDLIVLCNDCHKKFHNIEEEKEDF